MAKRRPLNTPSAEELQELGEQVRRETPTRSVAPIAQVAGEAAAAMEVQSPEVRAEIARDKVDAARLRAAETGGLVMTEIPTDEIDASVLVRDRADVVEEDLLELRASIVKNGLRLPIEVYKLPEPSEGRLYGLLSGYRRLMAVRQAGDFGIERMKTIKAVVRERQNVGAAYISMVEENEVRVNLSHFERGRIAVVAAQQQAFANTEDAVAKLCEHASRAKRSKIRSFAQIFEDLGDLLEFADQLTEMRGLAVAAALRAGGEERFRDALAKNQPETPAQEWEVLSAVIDELADKPKPVRQGGRPKIKMPKAGWHGKDVFQTSTGYTLRREHDTRGTVFRIEGKSLHTELARELLYDLGRLLEKPD